MSAAADIAPAVRHPQVTGASVVYSEGCPALRVVVQIGGLEVTLNGAGWDTGAEAALLVVADALNGIGVEPPALPARPRPAVTLRRRSTLVVGPAAWMWPLGVMLPAGAAILALIGWGPLR